MQVKKGGTDPYLLIPDSPVETLDWHGLKYTTTAHTDGGCAEMHSYWLDAIERMSPNNKVWESGLDWCAGDGGCGLMLYGEGKAKKMSFMEPYPKALKNLYQNLEDNNLDCDVYEIRTIKELPGKYDLVFGNSPSARLPHLCRMYELGWLRKKEYFPLTYEEALSDLKTKNPHRAFDYYWNIHKEFFANIEEKLLPGADIFLFENPIDFNPLFWEWGDTNLKIKGWVDHIQIPEFPKPQVVLHMKYE
jgi:hypothetical protein